MDLGACSVIKESIFNNNSGVTVLISVLKLMLNDSRPTVYNLTFLKITITIFFVVDPLGIYLYIIFTALYKNKVKQSTTLYYRHPADQADRDGWDSVGI